MGVRHAATNAGEAVHLCLLRTTVRRNGKVHEYWLLARSVRTGRRVRQQVVTRLSKLDAFDRRRARCFADRITGRCMHPSLFEPLEALQAFVWVIAGSWAWSERPVFARAARSRVAGLPGSRFGSWSQHSHPSRLVADRANESLRISQPGPPAVRPTGTALVRGQRDPAELGPAAADRMATEILPRRDAPGITDPAQCFRERTSTSAASHPDPHDLPRRESRTTPTGRRDGSC